MVAIELEFDQRAKPAAYPFCGNQGQIEVNEAVVGKPLVIRIGEKQGLCERFAA